MLHFGAFVCVKGVVPIASLSLQWQLLTLLFLCMAGSLTFRSSSADRQQFFGSCWQRNTHETLFVHLRKLRSID